MNNLISNLIGKVTKLERNNEIQNKKLEEFENNYLKQQGLLKDYSSNLDSNANLEVSKLQSNEGNYNDY